MTDATSTVVAMLIAFGLGLVPFILGAARDVSEARNLRNEDNQLEHALDRRLVRRHGPSVMNVRSNVARRRPRRWLEETQARDAERNETVLAPGSMFTPAAAQRGAVAIPVSAPLAITGTACPAIGVARVPRWVMAPRAITGELDTQQPAPRLRTTGYLKPRLAPVLAIGAAPHRKPRELTSAAAA